MDEEQYKKRYEEVQKRLSDPVLSKKVDNYIKKIAMLVECDVELNFLFLPHADDYADVQDSEDYKIPENKTMTLGTLLDHLMKEEDDDMKVYIDPIYLNDKKGVNEITDVLTTTHGDMMIIVPISSNKK